MPSAVKFEKEISGGRFFVCRNLKFGYYLMLKNSDL